MYAPAGICDNPAVVVQSFNRLLERVRKGPPLRYAISNRMLFPGREAAEYVAALFQTPADLVQLREKDLDREAVRPLVKAGVRAALETGRLLLVNSDFELAVEERADGVHLPGDALIRDAVQVRHRTGQDGFLVGKSVHSVDEAVRASADGVDYILLGPVFAPISKGSYLTPIGLTALREAVGRVSVPVFAIGGIDEGNEQEVLKTGVIGVAGISWVLPFLSEPRTQRGC